jgi:two-component system phosphate regulon sensor histidine kinase PhoR
MIINDEVIGMITVDRNDIRPYTDEEVDLAVAFANHAATALQNARLFQELETYSDVLEQAVEERTAELKRTMERTEAVLQNNPDAVLLLRADGTIETGNRAFHHIFGYPLSEAYDRLPNYLIGPGHRETFTRALQTTISAARTMRFEVEVQRKGGTVFDADVALAPIKQKDTVIGVVCSLRDISAFKEVERMKDAFVSNVSHELRSPITSLKLNRDLLALNPKKQDVYLHRLGREIDRLHIIVEDILRLSRLDQEPAGLKPAPVDLNELTSQYVDDRTPLAESKDLTLALEQDLTLRPVSADKGLIGQVLSILLTNAFNYTPGGGQIVVQTAACQLDEKQWAGFSVSDTGPGISVDEQPYLFDRFYRGRVGKDSGAPGTGLGLSITREIVDRHNGRIEVYSQGIPGQGATFTVWLPSIEPMTER